MRLGRSRVRPEGTSSAIAGATNTGLTWTADDVFRVRARIVGTSPTIIKAKVWRLGAGQPTAWTINVSDSTLGPQVSGEVGLRVNQTTPSTATVGLDNLSFAELRGRGLTNKTNTKPDNSPNCDSISGCNLSLADSYSWNTSGESEGLHQFNTHFNDPLNHAPADNTWGVNLDSVPPSAVGSPSGSIWTNNGKFIGDGIYDLHATAIDTALGSGISEIKVLVNNGEVDAANAQQVCGVQCPLSVTRNYSSDTTGVGEGSYHVQMNAKDRVHNPVTIADATVKLDKNAPSQGTAGGDLAQPAGGAKQWVGPGNHTLTHTPTDSYSGVMRDYSAVSRRLVTDAFGRTTSAGWGSADRGGAYTVGHTGGASFSTTARRESCRSRSGPRRARSPRGSQRARRG